MKTTRGRLAIVTALSLAGVVALVPAAPATPKTPAEPPAPRADAASGDERPALQSIFAGTGIGVVLEANGNEVPKSGAEMMKALAKIGEFVQLPITFSAVDLRTSLQKPRVVITQRPSMALPDLTAKPAKGGAKVDPDDPPAPAGGFGMFGVGLTGPVQTPINTGLLTRPNLEGRLFLAANFEKKDGELKVKTFEFISWNSRKQKFDFGFIECDEVEPQIRVVDGVKCFSCHKNRGPILGQGPWSNTPHNDVIRTALTPPPAPKVPGVPAPRPVLFDSELGQPRRLDTGFISARLEKNPPQITSADGIRVTLPQGPAVDAAVRTGADLARDREVYRLMARSADGRKGLVVLLGAIAAPGALDHTGHHARVALDQAFSPSYSNFAEKWVAIHKNSTDTLEDFNPSGSMGTVKPVSPRAGGGGWGGGSTLRPSLRVVWSGTREDLTAYDAKRAEGEHGLPSNRQPSNPKAFVRSEPKLPGKPSAAVSAVGLARLIGLTEGDRIFLADQLARAVRQIDGSRVTAATLAKEVFGGPQFAEVLLAGEIPDREDFKDRFVTGLNEALKAHGAALLDLDRKEYASGPNVAQKPGQEEKEIPVVATTACVRCHDVQKPGRAAFSPIPMLAFDPFDKGSREAWVKANPDVKKRAPVLTRLQKRLVTDADMPPEDSAEYDAFRTKNPAELDALRDWLDAELKKARGNQ
jgi:hypothetical protein